MSQESNDTSVVDTTLSEMLGYRLKRAYMTLQPAAQEALAELDLRVLSFSCLCQIADNGGVSQSALAEALRIERSNLVTVIDELETRGLIARNKVPGDRRRHALTATVEGVALRDRAVRHVKDREAARVAHFTAADRDLLYAALDRLEGRG